MQRTDRNGSTRRGVLGAISLIFCIAAAFLIIAFILAPNVSIRRVRTDWECINNLRQVDGAKEQWGMETHQTNGAPADLIAINGFMKYGEPKCPEGGTHVGEDPRCTLKGHELPKAAH